MQATIRNPILPGFHPDPCICRKGDDFYIANSSFQWWPGVPIYHSRDLVHWRLLGYGLTRRSQLEMDRIPDSGGIWAPALSYREADGLFYLVYTNVNRTSRYAPLEMPNYVVTAEDPRGPWSEPVYLNCTGFDPSFFHDDDGRTWMINMHRGHRPGQNSFDGLLVQEYDRQKKRLVGPVTNVFGGSPIGAAEGPHLLKRGGYYYILCAEGGTGYRHALTMARSKSLLGPYEVHPANPIMTARGTECVLQKAGHGNLVETPNGEWYGVFLCGRPNKDRRCILGRETAIERGQWRDDGWFYFDSPNPRLEVPAPDLASSPVELAADYDDFDDASLALHWNTLRLPHEDEVSLTARKGWLRLTGQARPLETNQRQALVARRIESRDFDAATCMEYEPENPWQYAGLTCYYGHTNYYWLRAGRDEQGAVTVDLVRRQGADLTLEGRISAVGWPQFHLRVQAREDRYQFSAGPDGRSWQDVGQAQDGSLLSDEEAGAFGFAFTGAFVGLAAVDLSGTRLRADFDWFSYVGH
ncbi:MAG TPA: glycoside hydrolase family 43 protein [Phycisphaerae bacterium]|nr:glycoside hydrolase family 43 protein [Phycisphaerae bacterium]HOI54594.1 glycoside hydrolase family 43 protein [Phycisphaerae bacterium]